MRSGLFCLICWLLYAVASNAQNKTEAMRLKLPENSVNVSHLELNSLSRSSFDDKIISLYKNHVFKKNNLLLYYLYSGVSEPNLKKSMEATQNMQVALLSESSTFKVDYSKFITVNNIRFSIIKYHDKNGYYLNFTSDYDPKLNFINGFIEYKQADEAEAQQYLSDFLGTIHFNDN